MKPTLTIAEAQIYLGNNLDVLPTLPDNSVDSIVCDPPYELGFMGKSWDSSGIAYSVELWTECLRVLKPGGHLLAFGGTRTWHRLAVAIEDAGFEIRDNIAWLYGSGFPKSHNISKAIDKKGGQIADYEIIKRAILEGMKRVGLKRIELEKALQNHMLDRYITNGSQPAIPNFKDYQVLKNLLNWGDSYDYLFQDSVERDVIATIEKSNLEREAILSSAKTYEKLGRTIGYGKYNITAAATNNAKVWDGWGTALKPAHEPIVVARKPVEGTIAENVLKHGVGALNIDATRIGFASEQDKASATPQGKVTSNMKAGAAPDVDNSGRKEVERPDNSNGRWPANIILDEYTAELLDEQSGTLTSGAMNSITKGHDEETFNTYGKQYVRRVVNQASSGGASRFFYVAKANKRDRNEGLDELPEVRHADRNATDGVGGDNPRNRTNQAKQNFHPTVKPTALMQYLIRLVTPDNGVVLDPFTGSGSTGKAAILEGKRFIGIELTEEYLPIIEGRLTHAYNTMQQQQEDDLFE